MISSTIMAQMINEISLQRDKGCVDAELWYKNVFTSPHELRLGWSMGRLKCVLKKHHQGKICEKNLQLYRTSQIYNKYPGMCCLHSIIFWSQGWINLNISLHKVGPIQVQVTRTDNNMVVLWANGTQKSSRNSIIRAAVYDAARKRTVLPIQ